MRVLQQREKKDFIIYTIYIVRRMYRIKFRAKISSICLLTGKRLSNLRAISEKRLVSNFNPSEMSRRDSSKCSIIPSGITLPSLRTSNTPFQRKSPSLQPRSQGKPATTTTMVSSSSTSTSPGLSKGQRRPEASKISKEWRTRPSRPSP